MKSLSLNLLVLTSVFCVVACGPVLPKACPPCDKSKCPDMTKLVCKAGVGMDSCDCCMVCLAGLGEQCGTSPALVSCGKGMVCKGFVSSNQSQAAGHCVVLGAAIMKRREKRQTQTSLRGATVRQSNAQGLQNMRNTMARDVEMAMRDPNFANIYQQTLNNADPITRRMGRKALRQARVRQRQAQTRRRIQLQRARLRAALIAARSG